MWAFALAGGLEEQPPPPEALKQEASPSPRARRGSLPRCPASPRLGGQELGVRTKNFLQCILPDGEWFIRVSPASTSTNCKHNSGTKSPEHGNEFQYHILLKKKSWWVFRSFLPSSMATLCKHQSAVCCVPSLCCGSSGSAAQRVVVVSEGDAHCALSECCTAQSMLYHLRDNKF